MPLPMRTPVVVLALVTTLAGWTACSHSPSAPTSDAADVSGAWAGAAADTTGFGDVQWQVTQSGGTFAGTVAITDRTVPVTGRGTVSGSILSGTLRFTMVVPSGGFDNPFGECSTTVTGDATVSATTITGTYAGVSTCGGKVYGGQLTLRRL
jgi:hypothetical protein